MKPSWVFLPLLLVSAAVCDLSAQERAFGVRPTTDAVTGQKFAFLVGVTEYEDSGNISTLTYTVEDVKAWQKQLENIGFDPGNIIVMASNTSLSRRPTKQNILAKLEELLKKTGANDLVICMFSGHGMQIGKEQYFCPEDARIGQPAESCVSLNEVMDKLKQSQAKFKWMIVDACRNDPGKSVSNGMKSLGKVESVPKGVTAIFSCAETETSLEDASLGHGVFTYYLIEGLAGKAADKNGDITLLDLYKYVQKETSRFVATKHNDKRQVPYWSGEFTNFVIVQLKSTQVPDFSEMQRRAEQGDSKAQNYLGVCYSRGTDGVRQNYSEAVKWYRRAAEQGFATAQFNLGVCYENGFGVAKDIPEALKWYRLAAEQGHEGAKNAVIRLEKLPPIDAVSITEEINKRGFWNVSESIQLHSLTLYGRAQLKNKFFAALEFYNRADKFDEPAAKKRLDDVRSEIGVERTEIAQRTFFGVFKISTSNVNVYGDESSFTLEIPTQLNSSADKFSSLGEIKVVFPVSMSDDVTWNVISANYSLEISVSGNTDVIRELVRGNNNYRAKVWFKNLHASRSAEDLSYYSWAGNHNYAEVLQIEIIDIRSQQRR